MFPPALAIDSLLLRLGHLAEWPSVLSRLAELGCRGIAVGDDLVQESGGGSELQSGTLREQLESQGMHAVALCTNAGAWSGKSPNEVTATIERRFDVCQSLGTRELRVGSGPLPGDGAADNERALLAASVAHWHDWSARALERGLRVLLQPVENETWTPSRLAHVLHAVDMPNFGIVFDTAAMERWAHSTGHEAIVEGTVLPGCLGLLESFKGDIGAVVLSETANSETRHSGALGTGSIDWNRLVPALIDAWIPSRWWTVDSVGDLKSAEQSILFFHEHVASRFADAAQPA